SKHGLCRDAPQGRVYLRTSFWMWTETGILSAGRRFSDGDRKSFLPAAVLATEAGTPFCRPPFQRRRPESLSAGRRFRDGDRKPFMPAAVSATGTGIPLCQPPFQRRGPETLSAGRRFSDGGRKPIMMPAVPPSGTECYSPDGCDRACLSPVFPTCHRPVAKFRWRRHMA